MKIAPSAGKNPLPAQSLGAILAAIVALPLVLAAGAAWLAWHQAWREAEIELVRAADAAAEYAGRVLDSHGLLVQRVDDLLRGMPDEEIRRRERDLHAELQRIVAGHTGLSSFVISRSGHILLAANLYPVPREPNFSDREFHVALRQPDAPATHVSRVFAGRVDAAVFFAVSRRRTATANRLPDGEFDGLVNVSVYPRDLAEGLRRIRSGALDSVALVRRDGEILARSEGLGEPPAALAADAPLAAAMRSGAERASATGPTSISPESGFAAARRVEGWPIFATVARPHTVIVDRWLEIFVPQFVAGLLAALLLGALAVVVRRQQGSLRAANRGLEQRVAERTRALSASEERLRLSQEIGQIGSWEVDMLTGQATVSPTQMALYGLHLEAGSDKLDWERWVALVHPDDRERVAATARRAALAGGCYHDEFRIHRADTGEERWIVARGSWVADREGDGRFIGVNIDVTDRKASEAALVASEAEFRAIFENSIIGKAQADPDSLRFLRVNDCFCEITGYNAAELLDGMTVADVTHPDDWPDHGPGLRAALAEGRTYRGEKRYRRKDGAERWVLVSVALLSAGVPRPRLLAAVQDVTERRRAEQARMLLAHEVDHRAKNALAVVQAALRLTPKHDAVAFAAAVEGRVTALARAQTLLASGRWAGAALTDIVRAELAGFVGADDGFRQVSFDGPPLEVSAEAAQPLSMILHELATNATKHGALSVPCGVVEVRWKVDYSSELLCFCWREKDGPICAGPPTSKGFGFRVIEGSVHQLGGELRQGWSASGLTCDLLFPLRRILRSLARAAASEPQQSSTHWSSSGAPLYPAHEGLTRALSRRGRA